jgi:hypothetical protein
MIGALLYLQFRSTWNRLLTRLKRLKKPNYLAGFLVGGLYFYFYFFRAIFLSAGKRGGGTPFEWTPELLAGLEPVGAAVLFGIVLLKWLLPHRRAALAFTEAEVTFLFPAPVRRRTLIHFKLIKSQFGILFSTLLMAFLTKRFGSGGAAWIHLAGWWLIFSTLNLHFLGASFARTRLLDAGISTARRRFVILAVVISLLGIAVYWAARTIPAPGEADFASTGAAWTYLTQALNTDAASALLYPFRLLIRPFLAQDAFAFLRAFWPAATLLVLHYLWVIRSDVAFEEASAELARKRSEQISAVRQGGQITARKRKRDPFHLAPVGSTPVALLWKNLIGTGSMFTGRIWIILLCVLAFPAMMIATTAPGSTGSSITGMIVLMGLIWSILAGPQILRQDFRHDLRMVDMLKLYPLAGWRIVLGELLAPAVILAAIQWLLLIVGMIVLTRGPDGTPIPLATRLAVGLGAAMVLPTMNVVCLLIPNAAVLLFPAWFQTGPDAAHGVEATGQRLILSIAHVLVFVASLIPAGLIFALAFFLTRLAIGWVLAVPISSVAAVLVLAVEAAVGIALLGKVFDRFDLSSEPQV